MQRPDRDGADELVGGVVRAAGDEDGNRAASAAAHRPAAYRRVRGRFLAALEHLGVTAAGGDLRDRRGHECRLGVAGLVHLGRGRNRTGRCRRGCGRRRRRAGRRGGPGGGRRSRSAPAGPASESSKPTTRATGAAPAPGNRRDGPRRLSRGSFGRGQLGRGHLGCGNGRAGRRPAPGAQRRDQDQAGDPGQRPGGQAPKVPPVAWPPKYATSRMVLAAAPTAGPG